MPWLQFLDLNNNALTDVEARMLVSAPLEGIVSLELSRNEIGDEGKALLVGH